MALQFVVRTNRKASPRVGVLRIVEDEKGRKIERYDNLGTLPDELEPEALASFIKEKELTPFEQYQLENYTANLRFNRETFETSPENVKRSFIHFAPKYEEALLKLWQLAKQYNIAFCPAEIQQSALLHKAKAVERKINELSKKPINILGSLGLDIRRFDKDDIKERLDKSTPKLFSLVLKIDKPLPDLCKEFIQIARTYGKNLNLKPHYFKDYATSLKRLPLWYSAIAIDLLLRHQINPVTAIPAGKTAEHWIRLRKDKLSLKEALAEFKKTFKPKASDEAEIKKALEEQYKKGVSTADA